MESEKITMRSSEKGEKLLTKNRLCFKQVKKQ